MTDSHHFLAPLFEYFAPAHMKPTSGLYGYIIFEVSLISVSVTHNESSPAYYIIFYPIVISAK